MRTIFVLLIFLLLAGCTKVTVQESPTQNIALVNKTETQDSNSSINSIKEKIDTITDIKYETPGMIKNKVLEETDVAGFGGAI